MLYVYIYLAFMGVIGFIQMGLDKSRARRHQWRIQESTLFLTAFLGAAWGSLVGMFVFRHKTKHRSFLIGIPCIVVFHIICVYFLDLLAF
ncbi:MAG: DUF1294 domain-containing protein [Lachnospiraceae bacterium]|nr:DUF1294 domain-containing protein [Lachnospiraceae bacterium]